MRILIAVLLMMTPAAAADKALILNDQEQQEFVQILDAAIRAKGLEISPAALKLLYKLQNAGVVKETTPPPPSGDSK